MTESCWLNTLRARRAIAVVRTADVALCCQQARAAARGGLRLLEIAWTGAETAESIACLRAELPDCIVGTGTIMTTAQLDAAISAGAEFAFAPHADPDMIAAALAAEIPIVPGALTPTEIVAAWQAGASCVKVFPVQAVGGSQYVSSLQGPLGYIPLIPTGGITLDNARAFLAAGAIAIGLSGQLFSPAAVAARDWDAIATRAAALQHNLRPWLA
ncbi:bifunctional 4-hydroxy-2-oxoglutarate aldolase/2-dehydro-3-deoxy-phosphogluconate aldolase [Rubidibacter lacunae]|nr:bifunctional 4-hydroxy-2-oxoglutarate aldolase/2-dehydro-3-deoxy-phosphogluconate aldolase [Rubidibacter lacunae]